MEFLQQEELRKDFNKLTQSIRVIAASEGLEYHNLQKWAKGKNCLGIDKINKIEDFVNENRM